jgi:hypothetical protein
MTRHASLTNLDLATLQCRAQWPKTYPAGRRCYVCGMVLSRYNPAPTCDAHRPEPSLDYCGHRFKLCAVCGHVMENRTRQQMRAGLCSACRKDGGS